MPRKFVSLWLTPSGMAPYGLFGKPNVLGARAALTVEFVSEQKSSLISVSTTLTLSTFEPATSRRPFGKSAIFVPRSTRSTSPTDVMSVDAALPEDGQVDHGPDVREAVR